MKATCKKIIFIAAYQKIIFVFIYIKNPDKRLKKTQLKIKLFPPPFKSHHLSFLKKTWQLRNNAYKTEQVPSTVGVSVLTQECWLVPGPGSDSAQAFGFFFMSSMSAVTISFTRSCRGTAHRQRTDISSLHRENTAQRCSQGGILAGRSEEVTLFCIN